MPNTIDTRKGLQELGFKFLNVSSGASYLHVNLEDKTVSSSIYLMDRPYLFMEHLYPLVLLPDRASRIEFLVDNGHVSRFDPHVLRHRYGST